MSRFNTNTTVSNKTVNKAGGEAYKESPELELASLLLTSFLKDQFYRSGRESVKDIVRLVGEVDPYFAAQAAVYARNTFGMRSVSHVVAGEIGLNIHGEEWTKRFFDRVVKRPDDMLEIAAYYKNKTGKRNWPNAMKKGFASALNGFNGYELAKYRGEDKVVSLVDVLNFSHPIAKTKTQAKLFEQLKTGTLKSKDTFEAKLSAAGKKENVTEAKAEAWRDLLENRKIGYFALLRNLRNIREQAPELIPVACELLTDEKLVKKSMVMPFQFLTAYYEVQGSRELLSAISRAVDIACNNVPRFDGKTLIAVDVSGSMGGQPERIASLFAAVMYKAMDADILTFDDTPAWYSPNPDNSTITIADNLRFRGGGTRFGAIFEAIKDKRYDRIFILSDMQAWMDGYAGWYADEPVKIHMSNYRANNNREVKLYSFDLQGQGTLQFPERNVFCVAGWSDKAFDVIKQLESGNSLVEQIKQVEI